MLKQTRWPVIALIAALSVVGLVLAGCTMVPTVTPVAAWPTLMPYSVAVPTEPLATLPPVPTIATPPVSLPDVRGYPLPTVQTATAESYPSPEVQGAGATKAATIAAATALPSSTAPVEPTRGSIRGRAEVAEVQVNIMESMPVQISLTVHGFLPDGCTQLASILQSRSPEGLVFDVVTEKDPDAVCTQALVPFEEVVPVDLQGLSAGTYVISVNGVTTTLELAPGMLAEPGPVSEACPEPGEGTLLYRSATHGFCFLYAADMVVTAPQPRLVVISGALPSEGGAEGAPLTMVVELLEPATGRTLQEVVEERLSALPAGTLKRAQIELGGELAVRVEGIPGEEGVRQVYVLHESAVYLITSSPYDEASWQLFASSFTFQ